MDILYRFTSNGEGIFYIGKRLLPKYLIEEAWEARKWLPKPKLSEGEYRFYLTKTGKEQYEKTLSKVHHKYLENIKSDEILREEVIKLGEVVYEDKWQVVIKVDNK